MTEMIRALESKVSYWVAGVVSAGSVVKGTVIDKPHDFAIHNWSDVAVIVGIIWILVQMTPKLYQLYKLLKKRKRADE